MASLLNILKKENNRLEKNLSKVNKKILTDMIVYLHSSNLREIDIQVMRKDLIGMALECELRGDSLESAIGDDFKSFCNELIANSRTTTVYEKILDNINNILFILLLGLSILTIQQLVFFTEFKANNFNMSIMLYDFSLIISMIIIVFVFIKPFSKKSFELSKWNSKESIMFIALILLFVFGSIFLEGIFEDRIFFNVQPIYIIPTMIITLVSVNFLINKNNNKLYNIQV